MLLLPGYLYPAKDHDLNIRGAYLHMAADALVSLGVVVSGFVIWKFGLNWFDPLSSVIDCSGDFLVYVGAFA